MQNARPVATTCLVLILAYGVGCGRTGPAVQPVEGVVTLDGEPCGDAVIGFSPVSDGLPAAGRTRADGSYRITAVGGGRDLGGTTVGEYAVTIEKKELIPTPPDLADAQVQPEFRHVVPEKYGDPTASGLRATVRQGRNAGPEFHFDLRSE